MEGSESHHKVCDKNKDNNDDGDVEDSETNSSAALVLRLSSVMG